MNFRDNVLYHASEITYILFKFVKSPGVAFYIASYVRSSITLSDFSLISIRQSYQECTVTILNCPVYMQCLLDSQIRMSNLLEQFLRKKYYNNIHKYRIQNIAPMQGVKGRHKWTRSLSQCYGQGVDNN